MNNIIIKLYDYFKRKPFVYFGLFIFLTIALTLSVLTLSYEEDISDFLPMDKDNKTALAIYQDVSGANKIYAIVSYKDSDAIEPQLLVDGVEEFVKNVEHCDSLQYISNIVKEIDIDKIAGVIDSVYANIPYFLNDDDYHRIDSLLSNPHYISQRMEEIRQLLMFPSSNMLTMNLSRDPLGLFSPVLARLKQGEVSIKFESYDGYILSPDGKKAIVILESSFGASESEHNADLVDMLNNAISETEQSIPEVDIHIIGGPVIAVSNAGQIKDDSVLAVVIAGVLILALLIYVFRNFVNIVLIFVSVGWGWLFAMGGIALFYNSVSIIVIGIASVILGIAINYPLHLIDHLKDSSHPREALKEIISPLIVGNITTVGAFFCLVPLNSPALHDLGLFASLLLVGTILFVLIFLPHVVRTKRVANAESENSSFISKISAISPEKYKWIVWSVLLLTLVLGYFSTRTEFDSDMRNINYMTPEQKEDMAYFQSLVSISPNTESLYVVSNGESWEDALQQNEIINLAIDSLGANRLLTRQNYVSDFLISKQRQSDRLAIWNSFVSNYKNAFLSELNLQAIYNGFNPDAFSSFNAILDKHYSVKEFEDFKDFLSNIFVGAISVDNNVGRKSLVQVVEVNSSTIADVKSSLSQKKEFKGLLFDVKSMNGSIADTLSDDFNYIGFACGFIVFVFLWISLGRIELAIISFIPMVFSWIWILGIMAILGIKFNIVNVILATFIFGQGDDYTIFMTEGLSYEYAYKKKLLGSYKSSIIVSALIMFIGIGTLLFAKHPALKSLGEVTVVGMLSVVLMAYLFPPLVFNWLVRKGSHVRYQPITLKKILFTGFSAIIFFIQLASAYALGFILFILSKPTIGKRYLFHRYCCSVFRFDIKRIPGIKFVLKNESDERFIKPAIIICNHQSLLDSFCIMTITHKIILLANNHIKLNPIIGTIFKWSGFLTVEDVSENITEKLKGILAEGYSIAIFPEGERPVGSDTRIKRFHKGAFYLAETLNLEIVPIYLSGVQRIMPKGSMLSNGGTIYIEVGNRLSRNELSAIGDISAQAKGIRARYASHLQGMNRDISSVRDLIPLVYGRYIYKGVDIGHNARKVLNAYLKHKDLLERLGSKKNFVINDTYGQGELAILLSLMYPDSMVFCYIDHSETREILKGAIEGFTPHVQILDEIDNNICYLHNKIMIRVIDAKYDDLCQSKNEITIIV